MTQKHHTHRFTRTEEAITVLFCLIDDAYTNLNPRGRGTDVIFTYRSNEAEADELVAELEAMGRRAAALQLDVGDADMFDAFVEQVRGVLRDWATNKIDFLVNNGLNPCSWLSPCSRAKLISLLVVGQAVGSVVPRPISPASHGVQLSQRLLRRFEVRLVHVCGYSDVHL